ncbi:MAG: hypothetical protein WHT29_08655 [Bacteroidales bacterium]|nr:hypothetical protein [Bacteroidales bacterium]HOK99412.1 hypothetical protein [Bacteroidales bacterium]HPO64933.1 hypothetical protein [Bacteroidales bacterium]
MNNRVPYLKTIFLTIALMGFYCQHSAQTNPICKEVNLGDYTIDGQSYTLTFDEKPQVSIYLVFFHGFDYRLHFCSPHIKKYRITLYDIEKKVLFSEFCQDNEKSLEFRFDSNLAAIIEISQLVEKEGRITPGDIRITVGFKENKQVQFK